MTTPNKLREQYATIKHSYDALSTIANSTYGTPDFIQDDPIRKGLDLALYYLDEVLSDLSQQILNAEQTSLPSDSIMFWETVNEELDVIAQFRGEERALQFLKEYGAPGWCIRRKTVCFADGLPLKKVYLDCVVDYAGDWVYYDQGEAK